MALDISTLNNDQLNNAIKAGALTPAQANSGVGSIQNNLGSSINSYTPNPTISSETLKPATPYNIPPVNPPTTSQSLQTATNGAIGSIKTDASYTPPVNPEKTSAMQAVKDYLGNITKQASQADQFSAEAGLLQKKNRAQSIANEVDQLDKQFQDRVNAIKANPNGQFTSGVNAELNRAQSEYNDNRANLALVYKVASQDLQGAQEIVNAKVTNLREQNAQYFQGLQLQMNMINNDLTESEKLQATAKINEIAARNKTVEDTYANVLSNATQNQAPASVLAAIDSAKNSPNATAATIMAAAGSYGAKKAFLNSNTSGNPNSSQYATDLDAIIGTTLSTIPSKFGQQTFSTQIGKARNDADKLNIVASQVLKSAPAADRTDFKNQAIGISFTDKAIAELDNGVKTGAVNNAAQYTYNIFGKDFDPKLAKINSYITSAIQPYRNSVTGAAWGTQEDNEYETLFGSTKYSPAELKQRLTQMKDMLIAKSTEGLNAYVNPLNTYQNPFQMNGQNNNQTVTIGGTQFLVGQVYEDKNGKWTVDANGNWSKQ